jgi:hypothetical protein
LIVTYKEAYMNEFYNHQYITIDAESRIVLGWSDGLHHFEDR